ncbi:major facilitator superfamily protein [Aspergillus affinis]|uniref:major facilitator superfamily protein n=1 Tax=Aspergillus affinis TaxID=1070780 RepID=UPI0022FE11F2|nr:major facilitator superfamily protein [Aspergillus affinis]KAI9043447.1 major facilitator superfamily protein [Aspergillus affinis]
MPADIAGGLVIAKFGRYKPTMVAGYALLSIGVGCLTLLDGNSSTVKWVIFQLICGTGGGLALTATLPAVQAPLPIPTLRSLQRAGPSFGVSVLFGGAAIPAAIFNSRVDSLLHKVSDLAIREQLRRGGAYEHATAAFIRSFDNNPTTKSKLINIYTTSIKESWQVLIAFTVIAVPIACFMKEVPLRKELVTEFGLVEDGEEGEVSGQDGIELAARVTGVDRSWLYSDIIKLCKIIQ